MGRLNLKTLKMKCKFIQNSKSVYLNVLSNAIELFGTLTFLKNLMTYV